MEQIKVSILVPVYGVEKYIERCAISLFEQTYLNIEYIFVNDCTKDKSIDILKSVAEKYPQRKKQMRLIEHEYNRGLAAARNTAVDAANGDYVLHIDSDDFIEKETVRLLVEEAMRTDSDIVTGGYRVLKNKRIHEYLPKHIAANEIFNEILERNIPVFIWGRLIKCSLYKDNCIKVEEGANMGEDYQAITRLCFYAKKISFVDKILVNYDCENQGSYTYDFKIKTAEQGWRSFYSVKRFVQKHAPDKMNLYCNAELKKIYCDLKNSAKKYSSDNKVYFHLMRQLLAKTSKSRWKVIPIRERMVLYIRNYEVLHVLNIIVSQIKSLLCSTLLVIN